MKKISLNGLWECSLPDGRKLNVEVPGCYDIYIEEKDLAEEVIYEKHFCLDEKPEFCQLCFGGVSYYCEVYVNGKSAGSHEGIWDHFRLDVTEMVEEGDNTIRVCVTKPGYKSTDRFPLREVLSGFIPDVLCTFGGIWDEVHLECGKEFTVRNHCGKGSADGNTEVILEIDTDRNTELRITCEFFDPQGKAAGNAVTKQLSVKPGTREVILESMMAEPELWSNHDPKLYTYRLTVESGAQTEILEKKYGYREISARGSRILLNGQPVCVRGLLHWGYYDTITPLPSEETIREEITQAGNYGFNMLKHCLYIPREEYLRLADEMGMLLWIELPLWLPDATAELEPRIRREFPAILRQIAGHPSVVMISLGCELDDKVSSGILEEMYHLAKQMSNALVRDNSGSGECYGGLSVDYADFFDYHFYGDLQNMENLMETFTPVWRSYRPWVYGEFCDSDTMRDLQEVRQIKGVQRLCWEQNDPVKNPISILKPDFFAGTHDEKMEKSGIRRDFDEIKKLSYDHTMVHRKTTLEQTRSFEQISGYNITSIRDVPIATSGLFDDMMQPKFDQREMKKINSDVVLVPAWDLTRIWLSADRVMSRERYNFFSGDYYGLHVLVSNYGEETVEKPFMEWKLTCRGEVLRQGSLRSDASVERGQVREVLYISENLPKTDTPKTCVLHVSMKCGDWNVENDWPVFLYPTPQESSVKIGVYDPANVWRTLDELYDSVVEIQDDEAITGVDLVVASRLTKAVKEYLQNGGKVIYLQRGKGSLPVKQVAFWREGMIRRFFHPLLDSVRKEEWFDDLRYFSLGTDTAFDIDGMERQGFENITPILRRYDCREWEASDYLAECTMGDGRMLMTTLRFEGGMGKQPLFLKNNRYARWMLEQMIRYLIG